MNQAPLGRVEEHNRSGAIPPRLDFSPQRHQYHAVSVHLDTLCDVIRYHWIHPAAAMVKPWPSPSVVNSVKPFTPRFSCRYAPLQPATKPFSTSKARREEEEERYGNRGRDLREGTPRWKSTPARYKAPVRSKPPVLNNDFPINEDPARLDKAYVRILGRGGEAMLTEEVKWLAVTHKSFDHGKRGYNDRLAFLGRIVLVSRSRKKLTQTICRQENCGSTDIISAVAEFVYKADYSDPRSTPAGTLQTPSAGGSGRCY